MKNKPVPTPKPGTRFFCSWSGGKDSCLALYHAIQAKAIPSSLLTIMNEKGKISRSHGIPVEILKAQAESMNIPLVAHPASWEEYESVFVSALCKLREKEITAGVFGDIDFPPHLEWEEKVCKTADMTPCLPLWKRSRLDLLEEFLSLGFKAMIVTVEAKCLGREFLGRTITPELVAEFQELGIDPCGENGEYHTVVTNGPLFAHPIDIQKGDIVEIPGYFMLNTSL